MDRGIEDGVTPELMDACRDWLTNVHTSVPISFPFNAFRRFRFNA